MNQFRCSFRYLIDIDILHPYAKYKEIVGTVFEKTIDFGTKVWHHRPQKMGEYNVSTEVGFSTFTYPVTITTGCVYPQIPPLPEPALGKMLVTLNNSYFDLVDFSLILSRSRGGCAPQKFVNYPEPAFGKKLTKLNTSYFSLTDFSLMLSRSRGGVHPKTSSITLSLPLGKCLRSSIPTIFSLADFLLGPMNNACRKREWHSCTNQWPNQPLGLNTQFHSGGYTFLDPNFQVQYDHHFLVPLCKFATPWGDPNLF